MGESTFQLTSILSAFLKRAGPGTCAVWLAETHPGCAAWETNKKSGLCLALMSAATQPPPVPLAIAFLPLCSPAAFLQRVLKSFWAREMLQKSDAPDLR